MSVVAIKKSATGGRAEVSFRYEPALVSLVKATVPGHARGFDGQTKIWTVEPIWLKSLIQAIEGAGHSVSITDPSRPQLPPPPPAAPVINWAVELLSRCSTPELRQSVYRNLSKSLHADLGGDHSLQAELNDARAQFDQKNGAVS